VGGLAGGTNAEAEYDKAAALPDLEPEPELGASTTAGAGELGVPSAAEPVEDGDDTEGARLIALNMALNGTPRDETDRYLAENFTLADRESLLDEVYASVEG
jgi:hypothetical protein